MATMLIEAIHRSIVWPVPVHSKWDWFGTRDKTEVQNLEWGQFYKEYISTLWEILFQSTLLEYGVQLLDLYRSNGQNYTLLWDENGGNVLFFIQNYFWCISSFVVQYVSTQMSKVLKTLVS